MEQGDEIPYAVRGAKVEGAEGEPLILRFIRGAVNVLTGRNGAGKSVATAAVSRAGGDETAAIVKADGAKAVFVEGPGVVFKMGARASLTGRPVVELGEVSRIHELMDPPGKTPETRDKNRAKALLSMASVEVTPELLLKICGGDERIAAGVQMKGQKASLAGVATQAKAFAQALARSAESVAGEKKGEVDSIERQLWKIREDLAGYPRPDGAAEDMAEELGEQTAALGRLDHERGLRVVREEEREKARGIQASVEKPDPDAAVAEVEAAVATVERLKTELKSAELELKHVRWMRDGTIKRSAEWDRRQALLDEEITGPEEGDVEAAGIEVASLAADLEALRLYEQIDELQVDADHAKGVQGLEGEKALELREKARGTAAEVNEILGDLDFGGLVLDGDGLGYAGPETFGEVVPFEELSEGQQARAVLVGVACRLYPEKMIPIDRAWFWSLDPERMRELVRLVASEGILLITELPTDQPGVRVVQLDDRWSEGSGERAETWVDHVARGETAGGVA